MYDACAVDWCSRVVLLLVASRTIYNENSKTPTDHDAAVGRAVERAGSGVALVRERTLTGRWSNATPEL